MTPTTQATKGKGIPKEENPTTPSPTKATPAPPKPTEGDAKQGKGIPKPGEANNTPNHNGLVQGNGELGRLAFTGLDSTSGSGEESTVHAVTKDTAAPAEEEGN